jgi:hypothetical protein
VKECSVSLREGVLQAQEFLEINVLILPLEHPLTLAYMFSLPRHAASPPPFAVAELGVVTRFASCQSLISHFRSRS